MDGVAGGRHRWARSWSRGDDKLRAFAFKTEVEGADRETIVAWSETNPTTVEIAPAEISYDFPGRELSRGGKVELTRKTVFLVLPPGGSTQLKLEPPPAKAPRLQGTTCSVVLQLVGQGDVKQSAFQLGASKELRLVAYNFGNKPARGTLSFEGAQSPSGEIEVGPGTREERTIKAVGTGNVTVRLELGAAGRTIVSARVTAEAQRTAAPAAEPGD